MIGLYGGPLISEGVLILQNYSEVIGLGRGGSTYFKVVGMGRTILGEGSISFRDSPLTTFRVTAFFYSCTHLIFQPFFSGLSLHMELHHTL